jgi:uncharacterized RDD family membrane protein YckC
MDWMFTALAVSALALIAVLILLFSTDLDRRDPSSPSLFAAAAMLCVFLPLWFLYTTLACSWRGGTVGMGLARLRVVANDGSTPTVWQAALRVGLMMLFTAPALSLPLLGAAAFSLGSAGPPVVWLPVGAMVCLSLAACASPFLASNRQAWHDRLSGTVVIHLPRQSLNSMSAADREARRESLE